MSGSRRGCCKCGAGGGPGGGDDDVICVCPGTGAFAYFRDATLAAGTTPLSVNVSQTTASEAILDGGFRAYCEGTCSYSWSGDVDVLNCFTAAKTFASGAGPIIGSASAEGRTISGQEWTASCDLRLVRVRAFPAWGVVEVSVERANYTYTTSDGAPPEDDCLLGSLSIKSDGTTTPRRNYLFFGFWLGSAFEDQFFCASTTAAYADDMSSFAVSSNGSGSFVGGLGTKWSGSRAQSMSGSLGGAKHCDQGIIAMPPCADGDPGDPPDPDPPGVPPPGEPEDGCCDNPPNATGRWWPDAADGGVLASPMTILIERFIAASGNLDRRWVVNVPALETAVATTCRQLRTTVQGQRNAAGGGQPATIPGTEAYAYDPQGFSGTDWVAGGGSTTIEVINLYMQAVYDFGDEAALPSGARMTLDVHDGIKSTSPKALSIAVTPGAGPSGASIALSSARIGSTVLADLRTGGQDFYRTGDNSAWFYAGRIGYETGDTDTQSGFRWRVSVSWEPAAGGFGVCPAPPGGGGGIALALRSSAGAARAVDPAVLAHAQRQQDQATGKGGCCG